MSKPKTPNAAERLQEVSRQLDKLIKSGRTKSIPAEHKSKPNSRSALSQRN